MGQKLPKRDKLGIHSFVEKTCIEILALSIESAYKSKLSKILPLELLRIKNGVLQNLIRTENELGILDEKTYLRLSQQMITIGKMASAWIKDIIKKSA